MKKLFITLIIPFLLGCKSNNKSSSKEDSKPNIDNQTTLVAYFSVTNHTKGIANEIKEYLDSDIFEIVPSQPYTSEDIDYNTDCRANKEQNDPNARPEIKYQIDDISKYDTIILGYPIWWGQAPKIMYTFVESYDLSNKTILPFCTSGSSPIGSSAANLSNSAKSANWLDGRRFEANASKESIYEWLDETFKKDNDMKLIIDDRELNVTWEDNASVKELKELSKDKVTINMHKYSTFEQVGPLGHTITSHDVEMTTSPGDIVLYSSNQIVVFFGTNTWGYTKLGHINLNESELNNLLNKKSVTLMFTI